MPHMRFQPQRHQAVTAKSKTLCRSCNVDTTPCTGKRGCRHKGTWDWYMVLPGIWEQAGGGSGYLCTACLEKAIGRLLNRTDFADLPVNDWPDDPWRTDRLRAAMLREPLTRPSRRLRVAYLAGRSL